MENNIITARDLPNLGSVMTRMKKIMKQMQSLGKYRK